MKKEKVVIVGASTNPERYSYKALKMLEEFSHLPIPVNPKEKKIEGHECFATLADVRAKIGKVETVTLYVSSEISSKLQSEIILLAPKRVIFNPGAENPLLAKELEKNGIKTIEACTLVMLRVGNF